MKGVIYMPIGAHIQEADWKTEKHVPVIECPETVKADAGFEVKLTVGREIPHPNTTEHHIRWISLFFKPADEKFSYQAGHYEFSGHGESVAGANKGPVYTNSVAVASLKINKPGTLFALALCNIHGLWQSSQEIKLG